MAVHGICRYLLLTLQVGRLRSDRLPCLLFYTYNFIYMGIQPSAQAGRTFQLSWQEALQAELPTPQIAQSTWALSAAECYQGATLTGLDLLGFLHKLPGAL